MDTQSGKAPPSAVGEPSARYLVDDRPAEEHATEYSRVLGERIRLCRGEMSRKDFAYRLGVHVNTVGKLERGETQPDAELCLVIASIGGRSVDWLVGGASGSSDVRTIEYSTHAVAAGDFIYVPHYDINASAGHGNPFSSRELVIAMRPFGQDFIEGELDIHHPELALIYVVGPSMEPLLHSRDTVLIDLRAGYDVFNDGIYVIRLDQALLVKQVQKMPGKVFRIRSLNPDYATFDIKGDEETERDFAIIGRVRWAGVTIK
jgi:phage repressor protein C with HTH and peptisase S24 domain